MKGITREPEYSDADQIAEVVNPYRQGTATSPYSVNTIYSSSPEPLRRGRIKEHIATAREYGFPYFVHEVDGEIVGVLTGLPFMIELSDDILNGPVERMLEITIAVKPESINTGAGKSMHNALIEYAVNNNVHSVWAGVYEKNRSVTINLGMIGYKFVTTLKGFHKREGKSYDLHLFRKTIK
jgi:RimJ/RimL family protein N-acetyltransferase